MIMHMCSNILSYESLKIKFLLVLITPQTCKYIIYMNSGFIFDKNKIGHLILNQYVYLRESTLISLN